MSHDEAFAAHQRRISLQLDLVLQQWERYIAPLEKEVFLKPKRLNMLDRRRVEAQWRTFLRQHGHQLSTLEYKRGFTQAWEIVRQRKLMLGEEG